MARANSIKDFFFQGDYQKVLAESLDHPTKRWQARDFSLILGALCFLGRTTEAETLYLGRIKQLSQEEKISSRFFLGLGFTRKSNYPKARNYFVQNLKELRSKVTATERFYIFQGVSFYRYFCGKWNLALQGVEYSFTAALRANFLYGRVLSADLRGHLLVQMGKVPLGLKTLEEAESLAKRINNSGVARAIRIARITYEAQFGISSGDTLNTLLKYLKTTAAIQDTYSHSLLLLELSRQYLLRGNFSQAALILDQTAQQIYSNQNRRQEVTLNLRYAYLSYLSGDSARGLSFIQSAKRALDLEVDHALELAVLGMEYKLVADLKMLERVTELTILLQKKSQRYGGSINQRILNRTEGQLGMTPPILSKYPGDPLGLLKDSVVQDPTNSIDLILKSGYLALLLEIIPVARGAQVLYLDLGENTLTAFDRNGMEHHRGLTPLLRTVLLQLATGPASKALLIRSVWKYPSYNPLHHDPVIYQAITALRKLLGTRQDWIRTTEEGYLMQAGVKILSSRVDKIPAEKPNLNLPKAFHSKLNHRQIRFLQRTKPEEFISVKNYRVLFKVSEITACRDLSNLKRLGYVLRIGKARATKYTIAGGIL